jgi:Skp family chaperone for outer membrane proteins
LKLFPIYRKGRIDRTRRGEPRSSRKTRLQQQGVLNVKKSLVLAAVAAAVVWMTVSAPRAGAQQPLRTQGGGAVALVDVNYIFHKHARFKSQIEEMKADIERTQADFKRTADQITKDAERLNDFRSGTPDYHNAEEELVKRRAELQAKMALQKREFLQREAKIYYNVYTEIMQEVQYYCQANNVGLVLSFNGDKINPENPDEVLRGINRQVVNYNPDLDITPTILQRISPQNRPAQTGDTRQGVFVPPVNR